MSTSTVRAVRKRGKVRAPAAPKGRHAALKKSAAPPKEPPGLKPRGARWLHVWAAREKKFAELFGPAFPKGKVLNLDGEPVAPRDTFALGWGVAQFAPRPGRLNWIYVTHGLSQMPLAGGQEPAGVELALYWRQRDKVPVRVLAAAGQALLDGGKAFGPGAIVSVAAAVRAAGETFAQCVACPPDPAVPAELALPGGPVRALLLVGISPAEMDYALKVNPAMADGRKVLMEALKMGGVFPITDPQRICMTRRRDFNRLWETAFHLVRERGAS